MKRSFHITYVLIVDGVEYPHSGTFEGVNAKDAENRLKKLINSSNFFKPDIIITEIKEV